MQSLVREYIALFKAGSWKTRWNILLGIFLVLNSIISFFGQFFFFRRPESLTTISSGVFYMGEIWGLLLNIGFLLLGVYLLRSARQGSMNEPSPESPLTKSNFARWYPWVVLLLPPVSLFLLAIVYRSGGGNEATGWGLVFAIAYTFFLLPFVLFSTASRRRSVYTFWNVFISIPLGLYLLLLLMSLIKLISK